MLEIPYTRSRGNSPIPGVGVMGLNRDEISAPTLLPRLVKDMIFYHRN